MSILFYSFKALFIEERGTSSHTLALRLKLCLIFIYLYNRT
ncbi:hypothetical protein [Bacteriophage sp.]|nr:hypothetical protein [Bacteriophage sp.]UOF80098.1 hypothetical protein [Bacteriophage sp.]